MTTPPLRVWFEAEGRLLRLRLSRPKANIVDAEMIAALDKALTDHLGNASLSAVLLDAEGPHFSFGATVEKLYLDGLMKTYDAVEGLDAFLEKRPAKWEHR